MQVVHERCAGLDVHKKSVYACVICRNGEGKHREVRSFGTMTADLLKLADWLREREISHVAMEATGVYWRPIWAVLQGRFELLLVNPHHIKVIPGRKTERDLTRYRAELKQAQYTVANRIQKLLERANIKLSSVASNTLGVSGRRMIEAIIAGEDDPEHLAALAKRRLKEKIPELRLALQGYVRDHHRFLLREFLDEWNALAERISRVEQEIDRRIAPYEHAVMLWQSIPGMDRVTACNLVAELGVNMAQFPSAQHLTAWAGLCPGNNESAGKRMSGTTRPGNKWLRRTLCQSAWAVTRKKDCYLSAQFRRLAARRGVKRAVMAVAHSMLIIASTMLKTGNTYHDLGGNYLEQTNKEHLQNYFVKRLRRLGLTVTVAPAT